MCKELKKNVNTSRNCFQDINRYVCDWLHCSTLQICFANIRWGPGALSSRFSHLNVTSAPAHKSSILHFSHLCHLVCIWLIVLYLCIQLLCKNTIFRRVKIVLNEVFAFPR